MTVATNNITGYKLNMSSTGDITSLSRDSSGDGVTASIPTLSAAAGTTASSLSDNTWGYRVNNTGNFAPYVSGTQILENYYATNEDTATLSFASKINYGQAAGTYQIALNITAVTNMAVDHIQNLNPAACTSTPITVIDVRDGQEYTVQRLADGNCWMMNNLNLGATELAGDLNSSNTNITNTISAADFNGWNKTSTGATGTYTAPEYIPITTANSSDGLDTDPTTGTKYGTLYNYCVASAGTMCTNSYTQNATYDICPAGWRLPIGGNGGEFQNLYNYYNTVAKVHNSIADGGAAFTYSGVVSTGAPRVQGGIGAFWSSTKHTTERINTFVFEPSRVLPTNDNLGNASYSVRCVMKTQTMQSFTSADATVMRTNEVKYLNDARDGRVYSIAKLKDGNVWMIQNLKLGMNTTSLALTNTTSDVSTSGFTLTGKRSDGTFPYSTINSQPYQYDGSQYYCTDDYGCYYNYYTASAGSGGSSNGSGDIPYSICPKGWTIPSLIQFQDLYGQYPSPSSMLANPTSLTENTNNSMPGFLLSSGYYNGGTYSGYGEYWSSTLQSGAIAYALQVNTSSITLPKTLYKYNGIAIRCIKK